MAKSLKARQMDYKAGITRQIPAASQASAANSSDKDALRRLQEQQQAQLEELRRIENEAAYATTVEQADEIEKRRKAAEVKLNATRDALRDTDPESIEYLGKERIANTAKGYSGQWLGSQASSLGTILAGGNALQEASSEKDRAINDSLYSGWVTDELTRQNFAEAGPESAGVLEENREAAQKVLDYADRTADRSGKQIMMAKENLGLGGQLAVDLGGQAIQVGLDALTGRPNLSLASRSFGGAAQEARQEGQDVGTQFTYGALQGAKEFALNKLLGGISKVYGKSAVGKAFDGAFNKIIKNPVLASALDRVLNTEGIEEGLSALLDPGAKALAYKDVGLGEAYSELEIEDVLYNAAVGQLMGILGGGEPRQQPQNATQAQAAQNAPQQTQAAPLQETAPTPAESGTKPPDELNPQATRGVTDEVMEMLVPGISNSQAAAIMSNPEARAAFESLPNAPALKGTNSQQRGIIKDYAAFLAAQAQTEFDSTAQTDPAQMLVDMVTGQKNTAPNEADSTVVNTDPAKAGLPSVSAEAPRVTSGNAAAMPAVRGDMQAPDAAAVAAGTVDTTPKANPAFSPENIITPSSPNGNSLEGNAAERGYTQNVRDSSTAEEALRQDLAENRELYEILSNRKTLDKAEQIYSKGFAGAYQSLSAALENAKNGAKFAPEMVPLSRMVANELTRQGRIEEAHSVIAGVAAELTEAGQLGQAGAILRSYGPAAKQEAIEKIVDKLNDSLTKGQQKANQKAGLGADDGRITVSPELLAEYANAETDEASNAALDKITTEIAKQIPATFAERFNEWRYVAMLGNLKTQGRNLLGNTAFGLSAVTKRRVQALLEMAAATLSGGKYQRTVALGASRQLIKEAGADYDARAKEIAGHARYNESGAVRGAIQDKRQILKNKVREKYRTLTHDAMEAGDAIFLRFHYVDALSSYLQAHGVKSIAEADPETLAAAREYADREAQEATFRDSNKISDWAAGLGSKGGFSKLLVQGVTPFRRTPANVLARGIEYSPLGVVNTIVDGVRAEQGNADASQVINDAAKTVTGSAMFAAGAIMALRGLARGHEEDEELREFQNMQGAQDWSIKVGEHEISMAQFAPNALPFFMGVEVAEAFMGGGQFGLDEMLALLSSVSDPVIEMSMLRGINDLLENVGSYGNNVGGIAKVLFDSIMGYFTQGLVPTLLRQIEQASEKNRQTIYREEKTAIDKILGGNQYTVSKALAGIPGADYHQQDYIDAWGRTQSNGSAGERAFNAFINPTYYGKDRSTEVDAELERLYAATKDIDGLNVLPQRPGRGLTVDGEKLSPEEYMQYAKDKGQYSLEMVKDFMASDLYKSLEGKDELRAQIISDLYEYAGREARANIQRRRGTPSSRALTISRSIADEYIAGKAAFEAAEEGRDYGMLESVLQAYKGMSPGAKDQLAKNTNIDVLLEAARAGVDAKAYYAVTDAAKTAEKNAQGTGTATAAKMSGIANAGISGTQQDAMAEILLGKEAYAFYERARNAGMSAQEISALYNGAESNGESGITQAEMYKYLQNRGIKGAEAERLWALFGWSTPYSRYRPK